LEPLEEIVDIIKQLCHDEISAAVDLFFQMPDFFIFIDLIKQPVRVAIRIG
jgi:hypothetical protein